MNAEWKFSLIPEAEDRGAIPIDADTAYDPAAGYGFAETAAPSKNEDMRDFWPGDYFVPAVKTFLVDVPYGNYEVSVTFGRADRPTRTTVKAGPGRLVLRDVRTEAGQIVREAFAVHADDGRLKLAFSGGLPGVRTVELKRVPLMPTLFLAGDSTVTDQPSGQFPYAGWGQMIGVYFTSGIAVSNHARSGRSSRSFITEGRLNRLWKYLKPSDYLLVQFAHNDEKDNDGGTKPFTTYQQYLREYINGARERGAHPVLVAPMHRRFFGEDGNIRNTHGEYIEAMRQLAAREDVPFLDLAAKSKQFFEELGEERTKEVFFWAEPGQYANFPDGARDNTHFTEMGGTAIAGLVAECIREAGITPLAGFLRQDK
jgi:lysophospholipase L1-like esterase